MDKIAGYAPAQSVQIGKKRTATEAGLTNTGTPMPQLKRDQGTPWYHHLEPKCGCGGRRFRKSKPIQHTVSTKMGYKDLERCTFEQTGSCVHCSTVESK